MRLTKAGDYAMRGLIYLARQPQGEVILVSEIAQAMHVPESFLAKIFQSLAKAGLVRSHRGYGGGYSLNRPPVAITLLEVIECVEGPIVLNDCTDPNANLEDGAEHNCSESCVAQSVWLEAQAAVREILEAKTMEELAAVPGQCDGVTPISLTAVK
ncbi:MAG: Rrf2 family transcriptional regulator [Nitrospirota bacterium]|jgi:Rrf2 family protein